MSDPARVVLVPTQLLTATGASYYTFLGSGNAKAYIRRIYAYNLTAGAITFNLWILPSGIGAVANQYAHYLAFSVATAQTPFEKIYRDGEFVLNAGDQLWASASALNSMNLYVAGALIQT
jgi:hypothetical protein